MELSRISDWRTWHGSGEKKKRGQVNRSRTKLVLIAAQKSIEYGFDGFMYGFAADKELLEHYVNVFNGEYIGILHPYQFAIDEENAAKIMEVYDYEWTDEEI